jgi:hypothetical protein
VSIWVNEQVRQVIIRRPRVEDVDAKVAATTPTTPPSRSLESPTQVSDTCSWLSSPAQQQQQQQHMTASQLLQSLQQLGTTKREKVIQAVLQKWTVLEEYY